MKKRETWSKEIAQNYIRYLLRPSLKLKLRAWILNLKIQIKKFWVKKIKREMYFFDKACVPCYMCGGVGHWADCKLDNPVSNLKYRCSACYGEGYIDYKKWRELRGK